MKIVVIGGTGLIGSKSVAILRQRGHEVVEASPKTGVNTTTGEGLRWNERAQDRGARDEHPPGASLDDVVGSHEHGGRNR